MEPIRNFPGIAVRKDIGLGGDPVVGRQDEGPAGAGRPDHTIGSTLPGSRHRAIVAVVLPAPILRHHALMCLGIPGSSS